MDENTIMVVNSEQFGDSWVFHASELEEQVKNCVEIFADWDVDAEADFRQSVYEYDLSDPDDLESFIEECEYEIRSECFTAAADEVIWKYIPRKS